MDIVALAGSLADKFPVITTILMVMGTLRAIAKPLSTFVHEVVKATPTAKDDEFVAKIEASKVYSSLHWALDYFTSIKLKK